MSCEIFFSHGTALEVCRLPSFDDPRNRPAVAAVVEDAFRLARTPRAARSRQEDVEASYVPALLGHASRPLHVCVPTREARGQSSLFVSHVWGSPLPQGAFWELAAGTYASTPEFLMCQLSRLPVVDLVRVGFELCGTYALDRASAFGFRAREALARVDGLRSMAARAGGAYGMRRVRQALAWVLDGSASPRETVLTMLLHLPVDLGGYGLPAPLLNHRVVSGEVERDLGLGASYACDLFWPAAGVAVEYDSDMFHTGPERIAHDAQRRNALEAIGVRVLTVTRAQIVDARAMDRVAGLLAGYLACRLEPCALDARRRLRSRLGLAVRPAG